MYLQLNHQKLDVYSISKKMVSESYKITRFFPPDERFALSQQLRRAALSVFLNLAEGSSRFSVFERRRFYEIARSSAVEVDAALEIAVMQGYVTEKETVPLGSAITGTFKYLTALMKSQTPKK